MMMIPQGTAVLLPHECANTEHTAAYFRYSTEDSFNECVSDVNKITFGVSFS